MLEHLKKYYGINNTKALNIIRYLGLEPNTPFKSIPKTKLNTLTRILNFLKNEGSIELPLKNSIKKNIKQKISINSIAGKRHRLRYPVRGQRTRSNGRTAKRLNHNIV
jgi:small subunit ribosomal protein S13